MWLLEALVKNKGIERLACYFIECESELKKMIETKNSLREVNLSIGENEGEVLFKSLQSNQNISSLSLHIPEFTDSLIHSIAELFSKNDFMEEISLRFDRTFGFTSLNSFSLVVKAMETNESLTKLSFSQYNKRVSHMMQDIQKKIQSNKKKKMEERRSLLFVLALQRRSEKNVFSALPRRLLIYLLSFLRYSAKIPTLF